MKSRFGSLLLASFLLGATALQGAGGYSVNAPVLGYVLDSETGALHRINGIPGASWVGDALQLGFLVAQAQVATSQDLAIVRDGEGRTYLVNLDRTPPVVTEFSGAMASDGMLISPLGRSAALYSTATGEVQFLDISAGRARVGETADLPTVTGKWTAFAISDRGVVLAAVAQDRGGSLYSLRSGGQAIRVGSVQRAEDLAFLADSDSVAVADTGANEVQLIRGVTSRRQSIMLATERDEISNPFAIEATSDGRFVAVAVPGGFASIPVQGGAVAMTRCDCAPTELTPLAGGSVFRLTADIRAPIRIAQVGAESRTRFIPALAPEESETLETK